MDISVIDKNLSLCCQLPEDVEWHDIHEEVFTLYGLLDNEEKGFSRLPEELAKGISEALYNLSLCTAGGRLRFKTNSPYVALKVKLRGASLMSHMAFLNSGGFDIYENNAFGSKYKGSYRPPCSSDATFADVAWIGGHLADLTLNFPSYGGVEYISVGLKKGAILEKTDGYKNMAPIVFYGSSITQGGCASRPGIIYENFVSRRFNVDYVNLGFSGNGLAEDEVVEYMASLPMSIFVSDYDHNAPTVEHLEKTHYRMYEKIRAAHPNIPYIMISKPDIDSHGDAGILCRNVVYESYIKAFGKGDRNVYYIDGKRLFAGEDRGDCMADGCHPNDIGMYRFADALIGELQKIL